MIRAVLDTNILISGSLWAGTPSLILQAAQAKRFIPLISEALLDELRDVLERPKFGQRLTLTEQTAEKIIGDYLKFAEIIEVALVEAVIHDDADDDQVLACAVDGRADYIVSGDPHLLAVKHYQNIPILIASDFLNLIAQPLDED